MASGDVWDAWHKLQEMDSSSTVFAVTRNSGASRVSPHDPLNLHGIMANIIGVLCADLIGALCVDFSTYRARSLVNSLDCGETNLICYA